MTFLIKLIGILGFITAVITFPLFLLLSLLLKVLRRIKGTILSENLAGKVLLITGASSGIGEYLAYEYARRGARLALAARREDRLQAVARKAQDMGSPDVIVVCTDVSKPQDCKRFVEEAVNHFGKLDHLTNNAGIIRASSPEDCKDVSTFATVMDTNFWGSVHCTLSALPHLLKSKGKMVVISSIAAWMPTPKLSFYNASKAAMQSFFETLRSEFGSQIGITIVSPGGVQSEITTDELLSKFGYKCVPIPMESAEVCAKAVVDSTCSGDRHLTVPSFAILTFMANLVSPQLMEWIFERLIMSSDKGKTRPT